VITPRRTRLIRVADLHAFRDVAAALVRAAAVAVVPTRGAARQLARMAAVDEALLLTRDELYTELHTRLAAPPRRLTAFERDSLAQAAAHHAASAIPELPFQIRPGLVAEMLGFYDHLRRQSQQVRRFEELIVEALGGGEDADRGAERTLRQTRFLAAAFREYERRAAATNACDEHMLRDVLLGSPLTRPIRHLVVLVADWIADPAGLFVADFDLLSRLAGLESLDLVATDATLESGFHERIHNWWPGLEEVSGAAIVDSGARVRPHLAIPEGSDDLWFTRRDREEELIACAERLAIDMTERLDQAAVVYKQPLPYLYLAPEVFGAIGVSVQASDSLPLAAEPFAAAVDVVLDAIETRFARSALIALLRLPQFDFYTPADRLSALAAFDRKLSDKRYLGDLDRLGSIVAALGGGARDSVAQSALSVARELAPLLDPTPASAQLSRMLAFIGAHAVDTGPSRGRAARAAIERTLRELIDAHAAHHDPIWAETELASALRRWIGDQTLPAESAGAGVHLLDDQAARFGAFADLTIVGLVENEWPERPRRNIFYPPALLKALGWPSEKDRQSAADARFLDLVASASARVELSTFTLEDETLVLRSLQLDEVPRARLTTMASPVPQPCEAPRPSTPSVWTDLRASRTPADSAGFHGEIGETAARAWSVSALETYLACPFRFYAQHLLRLREEPDDEEVMDPRTQGQFVHGVFESFFRRWSDRGLGAITAENLDGARALFRDVVEAALQSLSEGEAALERTRLLGSPAAAGLGEAVFRMEAERPVPVVERLLEYELNGEVVVHLDGGERAVPIRGKADRIDLLADGTFRLIDYKLGWPPDRNRALQLPIYSLRAEQQLAGRLGRAWTLGEAVYLAFKGPKRVVPLFTTTTGKSDVLKAASLRLVETVDAITAGHFPPSPTDVFLCETCTFTAVCRKDYVGEL
jgi:RecB family exonuclease